MKTAKELVKFLKDNNYEELEYADQENSEKLESEFGKWNLVEEKGNEEGGGEYSHLVYEFPQIGCFVMVTGCYTSYNGTDWENDWKIVAPKEKTITVYE